MARLNCWEFFECGREPGGKNTARLGPCPVPITTGAAGENSGQTAGRICWTVAGTFCADDDDIVGIFAREHATCVQCEFHQLVAEEEGASFVLRQ